MNYPTSHVARVVGADSHVLMQAQLVQRLQVDLLGAD